MTDRQKANEIFLRAYSGHPNVMTPDILRRGLNPDGSAYELSTGTGIEPGTSIYGVTVVLSDGTPSGLDRSRCFTRRSDAEDYIRRGCPGDREAVS